MSGNRSPITINGTTWVYDETSRTHKPCDEFGRVAGKPRRETQACDRPADRVADLEPDIGNESLAAKKAASFDTPVRIRIVSYRCFLADPDGISAKAAIDGLVHCGILADDSPQQVAEVSYRQVKVNKRSDEQTLIEIEEA